MNRKHPIKRDAFLFLSKIFALKKSRNLGIGGKFESSSTRGKHFSGS